MTLDPAEAPLFPEGIGWDEAQAQLTEAGLADGLPLVPPTARRMARMLAGVSDPAAEFGLMPPLFGALTPEAVAYQCVLAGCVPAELPVVLTAAIATLEPEFNLLGIQTTTGTPTVAVIVHGPVAAELGVNGGTNCLGPGNRANACIARALQRVLVHIGGAKPGIGDMATMGQPGKYGICFAEHLAGALPPLPSRRGIAGSAVTVLGVSGSMEVLPIAGDARPEAALGLLPAAMRGAAEAAGGGRAREPGEQVCLIPPEIADTLTAARWTLADAQHFLFERGGPARAPEDIHLVLTGGPGIKMTYLPLWAGGTRTVTRALVRF